MKGELWRDISKFVSSKKRDVVGWGDKESTLLLLVEKKMKASKLNKENPKGKEGRKKERFDIKQTLAAALATIIPDKKVVFFPRKKRKKEREKE